VCPTRVMAKDISWIKLKRLLEIIPREEGGDGEAPMVRAVHEGELRVTLVNGSVIQLMTAQDPEKLRGRLVKTVVLDEFGSMDPKVWTAIRPRIGDKELRVMYGELGRSLFIGTPAGFNHFKDLYDDARMGKRAESGQWKAWRYTSVEGGNIDAQEIEAAKLELSARDWRQEYEATLRRPNERFSRRGHRGCQQAESRPGDGGPERRSGLRTKAACLERQIVCGRILLGRWTNLPLRNEPGRSFRSVCFLRSAAHERRDAAHQATCLRLLRRE
jgi:hypothetical protein